MKRRGFIKALAVTPAAGTLFAQQAATPAAPAAPSAATPAGPLAGGRGGRGGAGGGGGRGAQEVAHVDLINADDAADTNPHFFTTLQFATLRKLSGVMLPPMKGAVGALDTDAPEFLDFLLSVSPAERQTLYRNGLDSLNTQARTRFAKPFASLDSTQADAVVKPLVVPVAWAYDPPKDPLKHFIYSFHSDIRTATRNSPRAAGAGPAGARRGGFGGAQYWNPIDPV